MSSTTGAAEAASEPADLPTGHGIPKQTPDTAEPLTKDVLFELLKNERRRIVLRYLNEHEGTATLSDLAEHVAMVENDVTMAELTSQQRKRVYVALYQCHLPILARAEVVRFNQARGFVERTPRADQLDEYLVETPAPEIRWSRYSLGIALAAGVAYAFSTVGPGWLPATVVAVAVASMVGLSLAQRADEADAWSLEDLADVVGRRRGSEPAEG